MLRERPFYSEQMVIYRSNLAESKINCIGKRGEVLQFRSALQEISAAMLKGKLH